MPTRPEPLPADVLDLDATYPPKAPARRDQVVSARLPAHVALWVRERANEDNVTVNMWFRRIIERQMNDGMLPLDCRDWLARQAASCGCPGDPDEALVRVIRHLARRYPTGARLIEPEETP